MTSELFKISDFSSKNQWNYDQWQKSCSIFCKTYSGTKEKSWPINKNQLQKSSTLSNFWNPKIYLKVPHAPNFRVAGKSASHQYFKRDVLAQNHTEHAYIRHPKKSLLRSSHTSQFSHARKQFCVWIMFRNLHPLRKSRLATDISKNYQRSIERWNCRPRLAGCAIFILKSKIAKI